MSNYAVLCVALSIVSLVVSSVAFASAGSRWLKDRRHRRERFAEYMRLDSQLLAMFAYREAELDPRVKARAVGKLTDEEYQTLRSDITTWLDTCEDLQEKRDAIWRQVRPQ